jgi:Pretoxin HINT domain
MSPATFGADQAGKNHVSITCPMDIPDSLCFLSGTAVEINGGVRKIEHINRGDQVLSRDERTGKTDYRTVTLVVSRAATEDEVIEVAFRGQQVYSTPYHPWYVQGSGWTPASELLIGDALISSDDRVVTVDGIVHGSVRGRWFNIEVADWNSYFVVAGDVAVWVQGLQ